MENATRALLIAGTVLLAIILVSIAVYLYSLYSNQAEQYNKTISATELQKFNSKFDVYLGRENITAQEIVSVVNLAKEYQGQIQIVLGISKIDFSSFSPEKFLKEYQENEEEVLFSCEWSATNPEYKNGKIIKLTFRKV